MFEYKIRTELKNGCKFTSQDILLYDYIYTGDIELECHVDYNIPGFGFVLLEDIQNTSLGDNAYIFKLDQENHYQIINRGYSEQNIVRDEYIEAGVRFKAPANMILIFEFIENCKVRIYKAEKDENGINNKRLMISYDLPHLMERYQIGFYSSANNVLKFASVSSESPSNWISNIFNGNGGRIHWIKNGFIIEDCEFDCEVESARNFLEPGTYYFDFKTTNPDIKYYIYPSYLKDTDEKRSMDEILATKKDERKNILNYKDNSFTIEVPTEINIKFKGTWGTVTELMIKKYKNETFVETDYDNIKRNPSWISFDLSKIKKIEMTGILYDVAEKHNIFLRGSKSYSLKDLKLELNQSVDYVIENNTIKISENSYEINYDNDDILYAFKNVNGLITKLLVTYNNGDVVDILLQKTFKVTIDKDIKTPILITDMSETPFDLSSSYRLIVQDSPTIDIFNKFNPIKLTKDYLSDLVVFGTNGRNINIEATTIDDFTDDYELISYNHYTMDYEHNSLKIDRDIRDQYKYIGVYYKNCNEYLYEFTNYARKLFDLSKVKGLYLDFPVCNTFNNIIVYGIPKESLFYPDRIYKVANIGSINSIDYCANIYETLQSSVYSLNRTTNMLIIEKDIRDRYAYIIVDYLKDNSYAINEQETYYEVDIATTYEEVKIMYDFDKNVANTYRTLNLTNKRADNFIVLKKLD